MVHQWALKLEDMIMCPRLILLKITSINNKKIRQYIMNIGLAISQLDLDCPIPCDPNSHPHHPSPVRNSIHIHSTHQPWVEWVILENKDYFVDLPKFLKIKLFFLLSCKKIDMGGWMERVLGKQCHCHSTTHNTPITHFVASFRPFIWGGGWIIHSPDG